MRLRDRSREAVGSVEKGTKAVAPTASQADRPPEPSTPRAVGESPPVLDLARVAGLDGLRGVTVIIVFISHLEVIMPIPTLAVVPGGTVSLDSFFVLSGFLITTLLLREQARTGRIRRLAFYRRRAMRLLPPLFAVLIGHAIFAYTSGISFHEEWSSVESVMFYYSNWQLAAHSNALGGHGAPGLQHLWSLSVEEQFYLVWPWITVLLVSIRQRLRTVVIVLGLLIVAIAIHRAFAYTGVNSWYSTFIRTDTRADGILIGCLLAHIWIRGHIPKHGIRAVASLAGVFLLICLPLVKTTGPFLFRGGLVAIDVACAFVLLGIVHGQWAGRYLFNLRPFIILGTVSYGLYLWHLPIFFAVSYYGHGWGDLGRVSVATTATLIFTALSWFLLERPALRWKDRLEGHRPTPRLLLPSRADRRAVVTGDRELAPASARSVEPSVGGA